MIVKTGPTGNTIKGHVLDVAKGPFERALKDYDPQLYVTWNPSKVRNYGCWEIRRKPAEYSPVYRGTYAGFHFIELKLLELDLIHHILDCAFLNYDQIRKIKSMDTWKNPNWAKDLEYAENVQRVKTQEKLRADLMYEMREQKTAIRDYRDAILSGTNPAEIARFWR